MKPRIRHPPRPASWKLFRGAMERSRNLVSLFLERRMLARVQGLGAATAGSLFGAVLEPRCQADPNLKFEISDLASRLGEGLWLRRGRPAPIPCRPVPMGSNSLDQRAHCCGPGSPEVKEESIDLSCNPLENIPALPTSEFRSRATDLGRDSDLFELWGLRGFAEGWLQIADCR